MPGALYSMYEKKKSERRSEKWDTFSFCALLRRNRLIAPTTGIRRRIDVTMGMYARMLGRCRGVHRGVQHKSSKFSEQLFIYINTLILTKKNTRIRRTTTYCCTR